MNEYEHWSGEFERKREVFKQYEQALRTIVSRTVRTAGVGIVTVDSRTKEVDSFTDKLKRKANKYDAPLLDITDLVGLRVVVYFRRDVARVCDFLGQELEIDEAESVDKALELDDDRFGYDSRHLIVSLPEHRRVLSENKDFRAFRAEIQVRTALQHAWATIEHKIRYKGGSNLPGDVSRGFSRLSAILELADIEFERIRVLGEEAEQQLENVNDGELDYELTLPFLETYLASSDMANAIAGWARKKGIMVSPAGPTEPDLTTLFAVSKKMGLKTLKDLDEKLNSPRIDEIILRIKSACDHANIDADVTPLQLVSLALLTQSGSPSKYGDGLFDGEILKAMGERK